MEFLLGYLQQGLSAIIPFVILLGLLIFVHELGHFLVAKYYGVRVEVFSLGFGKKILQFKRGYTTYAISLIPLGGYVKMFGDDPSQELPESEHKHAFLHKPVGQRIAVVLAGPLMNFFFAILLFFAVALIGEEQPQAVAGNIESGTAAFEAGFRPGDQIIAINGSDIEGWRELQDVVEASPNETVNFQILRNGNHQTITATPKLAKNDNPLSLQRRIGQIEGLTFLAEAPVVGLFDPESPAGQAGLRPGDVITKIEGEEITYWRELKNLIPLFQSSKSLSLEVLRERDGEPIEATLHKEEAGAAVSPLMDKLSQGQGPEFFAQGPNEQELLKAMASWGLESPHLYLQHVENESPAHQAGLRPGDRLVAIDSEPLGQWEDVLKKVSGFSPEQGELNVTYLRDGELETIALTPQMISHMTRRGTEEHRYTAGIRSFTQYAPPPTYISRTSNPVVAVARGVERTWDITVMVAVSLVRLVTAEISHKNVGGVISIGQVASQTYQIGVTHFLQMMAVISVNLFILNLLPIPILDGGHLVFFTIEAVRGAPLSLRKMAIAQQVGLVLLMSLMVFALFNDISRLFNPY